MGCYLDFPGPDWDFSGQIAARMWNARTESPELTAANARIAELERSSFSAEELNIIRQWHNAVQDCSPGYLNADGFDDQAVFRKVCALLETE